MKVLNPLNAKMSFSVTVTAPAFFGEEIPGVSKWAYIRESLLKQLELPPEYQTNGEKLRFDVYVGLVVAGQDD